jgi:hypothetical protein
MSTTAHRRRIGLAVLVVVRSVGRAIARQAVAEQPPQPGQIAGDRIPRHVQRPDPGAQEVIRARRAELGQPRRIVAVDKLQRRGIVLDGRDHAPLRAHLAAQPRQHRRQRGAPRRRRQRRAALAAEGLRAAVAVGDVALGAVDQLERRPVARSVVIGPVDQPMAAEDHAARLWMGAADPGQRQPQLEARPLPRRPDDLVAVDRARQLGRVCRRRDRDHRIRMHVIDMACRHERMQRRVDRRRTRIEAVGAVRDG